MVVRLEDFDCEDTTSSTKISNIPFSKSLLGSPPVKNLFNQVNQVNQPLYSSNGNPFSQDSNALTTCCNDKNCSTYHSGFDKKNGWDGGFDSRKQDRDFDSRKWEGFEHCLSCLGSRNPNLPSQTRFIANGPIAKRFYMCRESFRSKFKPIQVRVGFHYTWSKSVPDDDIVQKIRQWGLLSTATLQTGAFFGKGIYLSKNPHAFSHLGNVGILVLYIAGTEEQLCKSGLGKHGVDSFHGNKRAKKFGDFSTQHPKSSYFDEIIIQESKQVLPVFAFPRSAVNNAERLHLLHVQVQQVVDRTINFPDDYCKHGNKMNFLPRKTVVPRVKPDMNDLKLEHLLSDKFRERYEEPLQLRFLSNGTLVSNWS